MVRLDIVYLLAALIDAWLLVPLYRAVRMQHRIWRAGSQGVRAILGVLSAVVLAIAAICWAFMALTTADSWMVSLDPSRPKPYFLVTWALGLVAYGIVWMFLAPLQSYLDADSLKAGACGTNRLI